MPAPLDIDKDTLDKIRIWTQQGKPAVTVAALLGAGWTRHRVARIKERNGIRYRNPDAPDLYVPVGPKLSLGKCAACGADKSLPCPVPRCNRYDGGVPDAPRTMAGVASGW